MSFDPITYSEAQQLRAHFVLLNGSPEAISVLLNPAVTPSSFAAWLGASGKLALFEQLMAAPAAVAAVASNTVAMAAVASNTVAMAAVIASSTAMAAVAASSTAMAAVAYPVPGGLLRTETLTYDAQGRASGATAVETNP